MKKILLIALLLTSVKGFAQVTLEHTYPVETTLTQVSATEWDYYNVTGTTANIYSINHSLITTIPLPSISNALGVAAWSLSKNLFTSDGEYVIGSYSYATGPTFQLSIIEEDGTSLLQIDSAEDGAFVNTSSGTKLVITNIIGNNETRVYSLPGTYYATDIARPQGDGSDVNNAYPNPTSDVIHLPYTLNGNEQGELVVTNMNGQLLKQYTVTNAFNDILLNTNELPKGSYLYYLVSNGAHSTAKQFVVQ